MVAKKSTSVLVCVNYRGAERVRKMLDSVPATTNFGPDHVVIYDDGVPQDIDEPRGMDWKFSRLLSSTNLGVVGAYNRACNYASALQTDWIVLADDDLVFPDTWWPEFNNIMQSSLALLIGPISWKSSNRPPQIDGFLEADTRLAGYCLAFKRSCYRAIGGFDTTFHHYHGDSDFCVRATVAGMTSYRSHWPLVHHTEHASVTENPELAADRWRDTDTKIFIEKWGESILHNGYRTSSNLWYDRSSKILTGASP